MFAIIGIVIVFGCMVAGYLMEHGNLRVLVQPAELLIIGGAAVGTLLVANPVHLLKKIAGGVGGVFGGSKFGKETYIATLKMLYDLLNKARKDGLMALESDVEEPEKSAVFSKNQAFLKNHHVCNFVCDSLRMAITGIDAFDLDQMLDLDLEVHHQDSAAPTAALSTMADSLPGLGIVAAVLGVVITMGALGGPPEEIGNKVAAALVGTFLGILLCYGLVGPIAANMTKAAERACFPLRDEGSDGFFSERHRPHYGRGNGAARRAGPCAAIIPGVGSGLPQPGGRHNSSVREFRGRDAGSRGRSPRGSSRGSGNQLVLSLVSQTNIMDKTRPIIIVKKKSGHGGHHGGAWKVAYADFVTAMMALFIVLWLLNSSKKVQEAVGGYFKDPTGSAKKIGSNMTGSGENFTLTRDNMPKLKEELQMALKQMVDFEKLKSHIEMTVTSEGLRIELSEAANGTFFDSGSAKLNADGSELLMTLAQELGKLPNKLSIEGHTDSTPYAPTAAYGNWELSTDRANAARRVVQANGIRADQVTQVRGFADQRLRKAEAPLDPSNRRISVIVQYIVKNNDEDRKPDPTSEKQAAESNSEKPVDPARKE